MNKRIKNSVRCLKWRGNRNDKSQDFYFVSRHRENDNQILSIHALITLVFPTNRTRFRLGSRLCSPRTETRSFELCQRKDRLSLKVSDSVRPFGSRCVTSTKISLPRYSCDVTPSPATMCIRYKKIDTTSIESGYLGVVSRMKFMNVARTTLFTLPFYALWLAATGRYCMKVSRRNVDSSPPTFSRF